MEFGQKIRYLGFFGLDLLQGSKTRHHLYDLRRQLAGKDNYSVIRQDSLNRLLQHSCETVPFYEKYNGYSSISDFPVIEKTVIKRDYNSFLSSAFQRKSLKTAITSGSYGTPTTYRHTRDKSARRLAEILFFNQWAGYEVGMKHVLVRVRPKRRLTCFIENEIIFNPIGMDINWLDQKREVLLKEGVKIIIGYPSVLTALANYCREKGDSMEDFSLEGIISIAEPLAGEDRIKIEAVYGCPVLCRYSSEEFGVLAHQCSKGDKYHTNDASYLIEVLHINEDRPASRGELGRVVVTDFYSQAMPLIRYDTGDLAVLGDQCSCGLNTHVLDRIDGRVTEVIYDTKGRMVFPLAVVTPIARTLEGILQFQFIQQDVKKYLIRLVVFSSFPKAEVTRISDKLKSKLGKDAEINYEYVDSIKPLPSGKRPYIINEHHSQG